MRGFLVLFLYCSAVFSQIKVTNPSFLPVSLIPSFVGAKNSQRLVICGNRILKDSTRSLSSYLSYDNFSLKHRLGFGLSLSTNQTLGKVGSERYAAHKIFFQHNILKKRFLIKNYFKVFNLFLSIKYNVNRAEPREGTITITPGIGFTLETNREVVLMDFQKLPFRNLNYTHNPPEDSLAYSGRFQKIYTGNILASIMINNDRFRLGYAIGYGREYVFSHFQHWSETKNFISMSEGYSLLEKKLHYYLVNFRQSFIWAYHIKTKWIKGIDDGFNLMGTFNHSLLVNSNCKNADPSVVSYLYQTQRMDRLVNFSFSAIYRFDIYSMGFQFANMYYNKIKGISIGLQNPSFRMQLVVDPFFTKNNSLIESNISYYFKY